MKRFLKIFAITLGSIVLLAALAVGILSWLVFTPSRLTPIVEKQAAKYIGCQVQVGSVDLSLVKLFPDARLEIKGLTLINPVKGAPCDTLLDVRSATCRADVMALWKKRELILRDFTLSGGRVCVFTDSLGNTNYDIFPSSPQPVDGKTEDSFEIGYMDFDNVTLKDVALRYYDAKERVEAALSSVELNVKGTFSTDAADVSITGSATGAVFLSDSLTAGARSLSLNMKGTLASQDIKGAARFTASGLSVAVGGSEMLKEASVVFDTDAGIGMEPLFFDINALSISLNGIQLYADGTAAFLEEGRVETDISFRFDSWQLGDIVTLVPQQYIHYLEGFDVSGGTVSVAGTAKGVYGESSMPLLDLAVALRGIKGSYSEVPLPLERIDSDLKIHTDLSDDRISYVNVNRLEASTPHSVLALSGRLTNLFSDPRANVSGRAQITASEMAPFIPDSLGVSVSGIAGVTFDADVRLSHLEKMALEKMRVSGKLVLTDFSASYDTLCMATTRTEVDFSLPNPAAKDKSRDFLGVAMVSDVLQLQMGGDVNVRMDSSRVKAEVADLRDTTKIQPVWLSAGFGHVDARADSVSLSVARPSVDFSMAAQRRDQAQPRFSLSYGSGELVATMGNDRAKADKVELAANVSYDESQENMLFRFRPRGKFNAEGVSADASALGVPVEVPLVSLGLTPRELDVNDISILIGGSDFRLKGRLDNLMTYVRGDSVLKGEFTLRSDMTDIGGIMALTSGLGGDGSKADTVAAGPYMVPLGIDVILHADIKEAVWEGDTISDIKGDIYVRDGDMVLDELTMQLPGAEAQLTAIYRSPRRNHLFAGVDFHLLDVEIATLLQMIPDLDSMMPMLRSFGGRGEFHFAGQTNLDSLYNLKMSTLRGAASIRGEDLVLMDGETFHRIARKLWFRNKKDNRVDSLSAEFTIFRNEIDIYPFIISMDRYKAVVGGRHNLDMTFDYNISLVESPLPFRLAVNVFGDIDKLKFKLTRNKYPGFYRPDQRGEVKSKQLELREMIRSSLLSSVAVKEEEE